MKEALGSIDLELFGSDAASGKLKAVTSEILEGLNATAGDPGTPAPTPPGESDHLLSFQGSDA